MNRKFTKSNAFFKKASMIIPLGAQTFSKSSYAYIKDVAPLYATRGDKGHIWDIDGNEYIDLINGLLPVVLGYRYPAVDAAIKKQLQKGITHSLATTLEYDVSNLLIKYIPSAEMVRFGKNGSDVTSGAVRLARAVTGKDHVAVCGYHGWQDWYIGSTARHLGVPINVRKLTHTFKYNDIDSLEAVFKKTNNKVAAVIMEPVNFTEPKKGFLKDVRALATKRGALIIFDEVITGFRYALGGAQEYYGVTPDLSTFGKAMANGMPLSALVGKREYMKHIADIFYSFTFAGESLSLAAAFATIKEIVRKNVIQSLWKKGEYLDRHFRTLVEKYELQSIVDLKGNYCLQACFVNAYEGYSSFELKSLIQQEMLQRGVLWIGNHNISYGHTKKDLDAVIAAYDDTFRILRDAIDRKSVRKQLKGEPIDNVFKVR